jgi:hypothetical protein
MDVLLSLGVFGGGTAIAWFFYAKSKHYKTFANIGFGVLGFVIWVLFLLLINYYMPEKFERKLLMSMGDAMFSTLEWLISALISCLFLLFIPKRY